MHVIRYEHITASIKLNSKADNLLAQLQPRLACNLEDELSDQDSAIRNLILQFEHGKYYSKKGKSSTTSSNDECSNAVYNGTANAASNAMPMVSPTQTPAPMQRAT